MNYESNLQKLNITLPQLTAPKAQYIPVVQTGNLCFVSGQIPLLNDALAYTGKVGDTRTLEEASAAAQLCVINGLAALKAHLGTLDNIVRFVKVQAFVASKTDFDQQHIVANAASQLLFDIFGDAGTHARTAIGLNQLPLDATVEIEFIVEVKA